MIGDHTAGELNAFTLRLEQAVGIKSAEWRIKVNQASMSLLVSTVFLWNNPA